jgi:hypothetical protein
LLPGDAEAWALTASFRLLASLSAVRLSRWLPYRHSHNSLRLRFRDHRSRFDSSDAFTGNDRGQNTNDSAEHREALLQEFRRKRDSTFEVPTA